MSDSKSLSRDLREVHVVFLRRNIDDVFTYETDREGDLIGRPVVVPLGPSLTVGLVVGVEQNPEPNDQRKSIRDVLENFDSIPQRLVELGRWISRYYVSPLPSVFQSILPPKFLPSPTTAWKLYEVPEELQNLNIEHSRDSRITLDELSGLGDRNKTEWKQAMETWENEGKVNETLKLSRAEITRRRLNFIEFANKQWDTENCSPKENECLEYLREHGDTFQKDLPESLARTGLLNRLQEKELIQRTQEVHRRDPFPERETEDASDSFQLTDEQQAVIESIERDWECEGFSPHLLHGVTGSGKTEVYFRLAEKALERDESVLVLVPEITLAAFMVRRFRQRFGDDLAVLHSGLSAGERLDEWLRIQRGEATVVLGVQSAVFAPLENPGLIVVDEEHDTSYKAGQTPRYHARDVALKRGQMEKIPVILGSATPSLESYANSRKGRFDRLEMTQRPKAGELPKVRIFDLRNKEKIINETLLNKTRSVLKSGHRAIWFLNRRGYSNFVLCPDCGETVDCENCNVSLTYHRRARAMRCHYCGYTRPVPNRCPQCGGEEIDRIGLGTEKLEELAVEEFPEAKIIRMDSDSVTRKKARFEKLSRFGESKPGLLIGTQMVTKGLDFEHVDFVGVVNVDNGLHLPDFRAGEHVFQQLVQVCGRAGRKASGSEVLVQTYTPGHYAIQLGSEQSYEHFFKKECGFRKPLKYPPYTRLINIIGKGQSKHKVTEELNRLHDGLSGFQKVELLGPAPCGIDYIEGNHRWHLMARGQFSSSWRKTLRRLVRESDKGAQLIVDVDPTAVM